MYLTMTCYSGERESVPHYAKPDMLFRRSVPHYAKLDILFRTECTSLCKTRLIIQEDVKLDILFRTECTSLCKTRHVGMGLCNFNIFISLPHLS